jgi:hypothetical protein
VFVGGIAAQILPISRLRDAIHGFGSPSMSFCPIHSLVFVPAVVRGSSDPAQASDRRSPALAEWGDLGSGIGGTNNETVPQQGAIAEGDCGMGLTCGGLRRVRQPFNFLFLGRSRGGEIANGGSSSNVFLLLRQFQLNLLYALPSNDINQLCSFPRTGRALPIF